ncbi:MAG: NADH:ubiquinone reductase (Na(+)-transporting) subunit B [Pirellulales bacterium]
MKPLRNMLDKLGPQFHTGGKYEKLYPLYEAADTFLYTPGEATTRPTHIRDAIDLKRMMSIVIVALIPAIFMAFWNTGYQANLQIANDPDVVTLSSPWRANIYESLGFSFDPASFLGNIVLGGLYFLPVYIVCMTVGGICEVIFCIVRRHDINEGFLVTGMLFPLTLPPTIPLWQVATGIAFGVVIGKEIFGGTGKNFLNPALTARAYLYFAHPSDITGNTVWTAVDGYSGATVLGELATSNAADKLAPVTDAVTAGGLGVTWWDAFWGTIQGSMGETSVAACLIGAVILIATGIGSWRIMAGVTIGALAFSTLLWHFSEPATAGAGIWLLPPWWQLVVGGFAFGTVFMATDPVSASMTDAGKWIYGLLIGAMTILIRVVNPAFPEGIMLAILFGNVFAPLIDYFVVQANIKRRMARYGNS